MTNSNAKETISSHNVYQNLNNNNMSQPRRSGMDKKDYLHIPVNNIYLLNKIDQKTDATMNCTRRRESVMTERTGSGWGVWKFVLEREEEVEIFAMAASLESVEPAQPCS